jgi:YbgC/YbaW family acyl-CoA thioester hydrolase
MAYEFKLMRRVEFSETDMAGIVHFANFFRYMEAAEHEFFRSLGFSIHTLIDGREYGWPRVAASCEYVSPLKFEDQFEIHLRVREKKSKSIGYAFVFRGSDGREVARGALTVVCVQRDASGRMRAVEIPAAVAEQIEPAPNI